jgi:tRNA nucleotidyltransferase (CCA-adding enzyme)
MNQCIMKVPADVRTVCETLCKAGHEAWLVGGSVRDTLLGRPVHDYDIATEALPEKVCNLFPHVIKTGMQHGTVTVMLHGQGYEVTTYRGDGVYTDGRRPDDVSFLTDIKGDLARRDFTINALAYDPLQNAVCDHFNGFNDLNKGIIRAVGDPLKRFSEDGLRILRALRFVSTLGFSIEENTYVAMGLEPSLETLRKVSVERVRDELCKMLLGPNVECALNAMLETGVLGVVLPEFMPMVKCTQNRYHEFDVWQHTVKVVANSPPQLRLAALFHDVGKPASKSVNAKTKDGTFYDHENIGAEMTDAIMQRLKFSTKERENVVHLVKHHFIRYDASWSNSVIRRWVRKVGVENVSPLCELARADIKGKGQALFPLDGDWIQVLLDRIKQISDVSAIPTSTKSLAISGKDVMDALGIGPGPEVGVILRKLLEAVTDNPELNHREELLALVGHV